MKFNHHLGTWRVSTDDNIYVGDIEQDSGEPEFFPCKSTGLKLPEIVQIADKMLQIGEGNE